MDTCASTLSKWPANPTEINVKACRKQFVPDLSDVFPDLRLILRVLGHGLPARKTVSNSLKHENFPENVVRPWGQVRSCASWLLCLLCRNRPSSSQTWTPQARSQYLWTLVLLMAFLKFGKAVITVDTLNMKPTKSLLKMNIPLGIPVSAYEARPPSTPVEMICGMDLQLAVPDIQFQIRSDVLI